MESKGDPPPWLPPNPEPINLNPEPSFLFSIVFSEANFNIPKFIFIWKRTILQTVKGSSESFL